MNQFVSKIENKVFDIQGSVSAICPSNIALIKYWGKKEIQIPMNPSLSFTLNESRTVTELKFKPSAKKNDIYNIKVYLDNQPKSEFEPKIVSFFDRISDFVPFLKSFDFEIHTHNTFPHSSGIASSASGMGALALCLTEIENLLGGNLTDDEKLRKSSFLARLGSGSACRSVYPGITVWGETENIKGSSDLYAIPYPYEVNQVFRNFGDTILLIDEGEKEVSSTVGHKLMNGHPYAHSRFKDAEENLKKLVTVLKIGDLEAFGAIVEHEALSLHAMMMTSHPYYILMKPDTLKVIEKLWVYRKETSKPLYFTLDAGANIHLLYPNSEKVATDEFIKELFIESDKSVKKIKDFVI